MESFIEFQSVTKWFRNPGRDRNMWRRFFATETPPGRVLFSNLNLKFAKGEKIVIVGNNGVGKTTLLKLAGGFIRPNRGQITIASRAAHKTDRAGLGLMLSTQLLYPNLTGYQNLEYSAYLFGCRDLARTVENAVQMWGLDSVADDLVESYSNGRRALLALARATLHQPEVLLLDEPDAYLDETNCQRLVNYLAKSNQTFLVTTQNAGAFRSVADRVVTL